GAIIANGGGTFYPRTFYPDTPNESDAKVIEVAEGTEISNVDITVPEARQTRTVSGRVISAETGEPVAGIAISCGLMYSGGNFIYPWSSNGEKSRADGAFRLQGVLPGKYKVFAGKQNESGIYSDLVDCDLSEHDASGVEIKVHQGGTIN